MTIKSTFGVLIRCPADNSFILECAFFFVIVAHTLKKEKFVKAWVCWLLWLNVVLFKLQAFEYVIFSFDLVRICNYSIPPFDNPILRAYKVFIKFGTPIMLYNTRRREFRLFTKLAQSCQHFKVQQSHQNQMWFIFI